MCIVCTYVLTFFFQIQIHDFMLEEHITSNYIGRTHIMSKNQYIFYSTKPIIFHFRSYISFDILRRVMANYFGYDILYVMNITDIDDKIIKRARQHHLFEKYVEEKKSLNCIIDDATTVVNYYETIVKEATDPDKKNAMQKTLDW